MPVPSSPPRSRGRMSRRRASYVNPDLRVSDAERTEVTDRLSANYGEGRLDQAEFDERLDQAMKAKTRRDLDGLLADLPEADDLQPAPGRGADRAAGSQSGARGGPPQGRPAVHRFLLLALIVVVAAVVGRALAWPHPSLLLIGLLAFLWLRYRRPGRRV
jgi:hypothetical protein